MIKEIENLIGYSVRILNHRMFSKSSIFTSDVTSEILLLVFMSEVKFDLTLTNSNILYMFMSFLQVSNGMVNGQAKVYDVYDPIGDVEMTPDTKPPDYTYDNPVFSTTKM